MQKWKLSDFYSYRLCKEFVRFFFTKELIKPMAFSIYVHITTVCCHGNDNSFIF